jgi:membrane-bound metal-dependent hydrolase YbcI (DUF457 family)
MPFTPFHFGPHACVSLPLHRHIDVPVFLAANIAVDIEPLLVMVYRLHDPLHGYCHTFLIGGLVGILLGFVLFPFRRAVGKAMFLFRLPYSSTLSKMLFSGILGAWIHILFDAPLYQDIRPFYPLSANPLYGLASMKTIYGISALLFLPALVMYLFIALSRTPKKEEGS